MADVSGEGADGVSIDRLESSPTTASSLTVSASFKDSGPGKGSSRRRPVRPPSMDADNEFITLLHGSDPVKLELNRLENEVRGSKCGLIYWFECVFTTVTLW